MRIKHERKKQLQKFNVQKRDSITNSSTMKQGEKKTSETDNGWIKRFWINKLSISHILYVDDTLLLCESSSWKIRR